MKNRDAKCNMVICDVWGVCDVCCAQATAGGGGRGMRLANEPGEFVKLLQVSHTLCL